MIADIVEREVKAPKPPKMQETKSLWGARKAARQSKPKEGLADMTPSAAKRESSRASGASGASGAPSGAPRAPSNVSSSTPSDALSEQEKIHLKNLQVLNSMSPAEIEKQKQQLIDTMDPKILQALLKRAELKEQEHEQVQEQEQGQNRAGHRDAPAPASLADVDPPTVAQEEANVTEARPNPEKTSQHSDARPDARRDASEPAQVSMQAQAAQTTGVDLHFPPPPEELKKYFPELPVETAKMAWMQPVDAEEEAEYSSELVSVAPSQLRFDFNGDLLTPRASAALDTNLGLHHHADAPGAAGYTIPELAHLARSSHPSQRTIAIRTVGRILHKLVNGKFNKSSELQYGLEQLVKSTRIEETLLEAASDQTRSLTVRTHATEALWLYHNRV